MRRIWFGIGGFAVLAILAAIMFGVSSAHAAPTQTQATASHSCKSQRTVAQEKAFLQAHGASSMADHLTSVTFACPGDASASEPNWGQRNRVIAAPAKP
jgi:hypothetical protein